MGIKILKDQTGQVLVMTALSMTVLVGFLALAIDVGMLFRAKRNMQIAADAAAIAGALDYKYNSSVSSAQAAGEAAATANGLTATGTCPISDPTKTYVCINIPPVYGANAGVPGFVEALVTQPNRTIFMPMVSHSSNSVVAVGARAVAGSTTSSACIWTLAKSGKDISLTGSGSIIAKKCGIYDDSNASDALTLTGSGSVSAKTIGIAGGYSDTSSGTLTLPIRPPLESPLRQIHFPPYRRQRLPVAPARGPRPHVIRATLGAGTCPFLQELTLRFPIPEVEL